MRECKLFAIVSVTIGLCQRKNARANVPLVVEKNTWECYIITSFNSNNLYVFIMENKMDVLQALCDNSIRKQNKAHEKTCLPVRLIPACSATEANIKRLEISEI